MANLGAAKQIIYTAVGSISVRVVFTNPTSAGIVRNFASNSVTYELNVLAGVNCISEYSINLIAGDYLIAQAGSAGITYHIFDINGVDITPVPVTDTSAQHIIALAQTAVGITLTNLTQAQRNSLMAILLYKAGGVDAVTLKVKPLNQWAQ